VRSVESLLKTMRRLWLLEHSARRLLLLVGWAVDAWLLGLLLYRAAGIRTPGAVVFALAAALAGAAIVLAARLAAPGPSRLAQMLDDRAGTRDLFASALEFRAQPERFGWLGELTREMASAEASRVALRPRWALGPMRHGAALAATAVLLGVAYAAVAVFRSSSSSFSSLSSILPSRTEEEPRRSTRTTEEATPRPEEPSTTPAPETEKPAEEAVKITSEMIDKYLKEVPQQQEIDLEGVTPIRWDNDEVSGKANPQNQRREGEKIDPVKLDAALLKDLQEAKKTKAEGKQEGGVDVAVIGESPQGTKAKGKPGGKDDKGSLAGAVSKDPRGQPTRMAVPPPRTGMEVRSASRSPVKQPGQERPMGLLDFLAAMKRAQAAALGPAETAAPQVAPGPQDHVIHQEPVPDAAGVIESYFGRLRKADR